MPISVDQVTRGQKLYHNHQNILYSLKDCCNVTLLCVVKTCMITLAWPLNTI